MTESWEQWMLLSLALVVFSLGLAGFACALKSCNKPFLYVWVPSTPRHVTVAWIPTLTTDPINGTLAHDESNICGNFFRTYSFNWWYLPLFLGKFMTRSLLAFHLASSGLCRWSSFVHATVASRLTSSSHPNLLLSQPRHASITPLLCPARSCGAEPNRYRANSLACCLRFPSQKWK